MDDKDMEYPKLEIIEKDITSNIEQYFTKTELSSMSEYEKLRFKNMKKNYDIMIKLGLPAVRPSFMIKQRNKKKCKDEVPSSDSDEEWTPDVDRRRSKREAKKTVPFHAPLQKKRTRRVQDKENMKVKVEKNVVRKDLEKRLYPLRKGQHPSYMKIEIPDDDEYLFCEECDKEYEDDCPIHGPLEIIEDATVSSDRGKSVAELSIPSGLVIRTSSIPNAGLGVFAEKEFKSRSRFGPYKGETIKDIDRAHASGYCWQIHIDGQPSHFVDAASDSLSNWLRYVNCARNESEQNLTAYQYHSEIFYRSHKHILPGTELLVWYGCDYGIDLGISRTQDSKYSVKKMPDIGKELDLTAALTTKKCQLNNEDIFLCPLCGCGFNQDTPLLKHLKRKHSVFIPWELNCTISNNNHTGVQNEDRPLQRICNSEEERNEKTVSDGINSVCSSDVYYSEVVGCNQLTNKMEGQYKKFYNCNFCEMTFKSNYELTVHMRTHSNDICFEGSVFKKGCTQSGHLTKDMSIDSNDKPYKCSVCSKAYTTSGSLTAHMRIHSNDRPYKCSVCSKVFTTSGSLTAHMRIHSNDRPYKCSVCSKAFTESCNLTAHMRLHSNDRPYKCSVCSKCFTQSGYLTAHMRIHSNDRPYKCSVCCKAFTVSRYLTKHMRIHSNDRPYKCSVCSKAFTESGSLTKHMRIHSNDRPYKCSVCSKAFTVSGHLTAHMRIHSNDRPYKCSVCSKAFTESCNLTAHMRIHSNDRPYKCSVCSKCFTRSCTLTTHMRIHSNDRPYKCSVCSKAFTESGNLTKHMRIHSNDRPYKCSVCSKAFTVSGHLTKHMRIHSNDRPYKCSVCSKAFTESCNLTAHMRIHSNDRPYKCSVCSKCFTQSGYMTAHMRIHSNDRPYKCSVCSKAFTVSDHLTKHMRIHSNETLQV